MKRIYHIVTSITIKIYMSLISSSFFLAYVTKEQWGKISLAKKLNMNNQNSTPLTSSFEPNENKKIHFFSFLTAFINLLVIKWKFPVDFQIILDMFLRICFWKRLQYECTLKYFDWPQNKFFPNLKINKKKKIQTFNHVVIMYL